MDPQPTPLNTDSRPPEDAHAKQAESLVGWFRANWQKVAVLLVLVAVVSKYLHPLDVLLAAGGLSLIIFLHELGHFVAAKLCDIHVKTFSIGFGPALPFCQFRYGETTYKLAMIPLGGYVAMVGEGEEEGDIVEGASDPEEARNDPRSFKNKSVAQRMFVISAGVIMNLVLACVCFVASYLHGVKEAPAIATHVEPGSAAWRAGIHSGTRIARIDGRDDPWFDDIRPAVSSTSAGETVDLVLEYAGRKRSLELEPLRPEGALFPQLGITPPGKMEVQPPRRGERLAALPGSPAAKATAADGGPGFRPGDRIVAMTDIDDPATVTPLAEHPDAGLPTPYFDYERRLRRLAANPATAGQPITFHVVGLGETEPRTVVMPPGHRQTIGARMRMGPVAAVRVGSSAEGKIRPRQSDGDAETVPGDRIISVEVTGPDGKTTRYGGEGGEPLDPLKLPFQLARWAETQPKSWNPADTPIRVVVMREDGEKHTEERVTLDLTWDRSYELDISQPVMPGSPVPIPGLGVAYRVVAMVNGVEPGSPAEKAGLQPNDLIKEVRFKSLTPDGQEKFGSWEPVLPHHWPFADLKMQSQPPHTFEAKVERGQEKLTVELGAVPDPTWPITETGLLLASDTRLHQADGVTEALAMGAHRTVRSIRVIYLQLYALVAGRISVKMMSGPITLARASYILAGEDIWTLVLFLGLISVNLAVVNFLPIPVLDGGHMMFLLYEGVRGRPAPDWLHASLTYAGLGMVACLMLFVLGLDIWRLFFA